jgi:peptidyl-prolyl cis-trans isomerase A (cyclophilin A)
MQSPAIDVPGSGQLYARLKTTQGTIVVLLEEQRAPQTVQNFVGLALGTKAWTDEITGEKKSGVSLYQGVKFHRVIPGFMVQVGDPTTRHDAARGRWGTGGPGYRFADEFHAELRHDRGGVLSMANAGPGTNGSQFFITEGPTPHLDRRHSVFGRVVVGQDVVSAIANVDRDGRDCPRAAQTIDAIEVFRSATAPTS